MKNVELFSNVYRKLGISRKKYFIACLVICLSLTQFMKSRNLGFLEDLRYLSIDLGGGKCKWTVPDYDAPSNVTYDKTLIVGFPGGDKRLLYVQMEALTGVSANDEWFYEPDANRPYLKTNYPHHEGTWSWGSTANQVIMIVRSIRKSLPEYHDVLADIEYAMTPMEAFRNKDRLYIERAELDKFLEWRDSRASAEIQWYGWFIDYWMEGGLLRDIMTHRLTTKSHWERQMQPSEYTESELAFQDFVGNIEVPMTYDEHCLNEVPGGCEPVVVVSGDRLIDLVDGPSEIEKVGLALEGRKNIDVISREARACIWNEVVVNRKGVRTLLDRGGNLSPNAYGFTADHLQQMIDELTRLRDKYSAPGWIEKQISKDLVSILEQDMTNIQVELDDMLASNSDRSRGYQCRHLKSNEKMQDKEQEQENTSEP